MRILVTSVHVPFVRGGAEVLAEDLVRALRSRGHEAEILAVPFSSHPPERIMDQVLSCRLIDLDGFVGKPIDRVIALKFPAYVLRHHDTTTWLCHQHREAYELWDATPSLADLDIGPEVQAAVHHLDVEVLGAMERRYTISANVAERLDRWCGLSATVLHPPIGDAESFRTADAEPFLFAPSRLTATKRQGLAIEALALAPEVRLVLAGGADDARIEDRLLAQAEALGVADRLEVLGHIDRATMIDLYARCRGVVFIPFDEDYGYVTIEAMLAAKPVLTCTDSGGPLEFVLDGHTGTVVAPEVEAIAEGMAQLWDPARAREMGSAGAQRYRSMATDWDVIVDELTRAR